MKHKSFKHAFYIAALSVFLTQWGCGSSGGGSSGTATMSGTIQYEDKQYDAAGFTGTILKKAVRYSRVEIVDPYSGSVLGAGTTDANGAYSISFSFNRSLVYARTISEATPPGASIIMVKTLSGALYGVGSGDVSVTSGAQVNVDITIQTTNQAGGAFNIMDVLTSGFEFVNALSGTWPPALSVYWESSSAEGTYYCTGVGCPRGEGIYVRGYYNGDTDGYDDDVIWHEFGHFIASKYSRDDSPGGYHSLNSNDLDLRLSWSEGWGDFFPGAVKTWLNATDPGLISSITGTPVYYVDTVGSATGISFDFDNPDSEPICSSSKCDYSSNEVAVTKVLWDLMNNFSFGMQPVWNVVSSFTSTNPSTPVNLEAFWEGWRLRPTFASEKATLEAIYGDRMIFYKEDSFETDDGFPVTRSTFTVNGPGETHYLYKEGSADTDVVPFDVVSGLTYSIRTVNLKNGADTFVRIISDTTGTYVPGAANDNVGDVTYTPPFNCTCLNPPFCSITVCHENGGDLLGSEIILPNTTPPGKYYVEISSSPYINPTTLQPQKPTSAGRYGTYTLTITSP